MSSISGISFPNLINGNENIVENCKYLCSLTDPDKPYIVTGTNSGKAMAVGYTYQKSVNTQHARFIYISISFNYICSVRCYDSIWEIIEIK